MHEHEDTEIVVIAARSGCAYCGRKRPRRRIPARSARGLVLAPGYAEWSGEQTHCCLATARMPADVGASRMVNGRPRPRTAEREVTPAPAEVSIPVQVASVETVERRPERESMPFFGGLFGW